MNNLLLRRRMLMQAGGSPTPPTPYDAEVEYIESSQQQYIDTGFYPTINTLIQFKVYIGLHTNGSIITGYFNEVDDRNDYRFLNVGNTFYYDSGGGRRKAISALFTYQSWIEVELGNYYVKNLISQVREIAGVPYSSSQIGFYPLYLDATPQTPNNSRGANKWAKYQIYDNSVLVFDGIPVRKSGKGYLWDNVSQQLFGSQTATPYTYGPDIN